MSSYWRFVIFCGKFFKCQCNLILDFFSFYWSYWEGNMQWDLFILIYLSRVLLARKLLGSSSPDGEPHASLQHCCAASTLIVNILHIILWLCVIVTWDLPAGLLPTMEDRLFWQSSCCWLKTSGMFSFVLFKSLLSARSTICHLSWNC